MNWGHMLVEAGVTAGVVLAWMTYGRTQELRYAALGALALISLLMWSHS